MQIVIDILEKLYNRMKTYQGLDDTYVAVKHGIPLPEGAEILSKEAYSDLCMRASHLRDESYDFANWVATEIFDENWEYNKDAFAELACRKLAKLGIVRANGDEWELVDPQESEEK